MKRPRANGAAFFSIKYCVSKLEARVSCPLPPELGYTRVRHVLECSKSETSHFDWERAAPTCQRIRMGEGYLNKSDFSREAPSPHRNPATCLHAPLPQGEGHKYSRRNQRDLAVRYTALRCASRRL